MCDVRLYALEKILSQPGSAQAYDVGLTFLGFLTVGGRTRCRRRFAVGADDGEEGALGLAITLGGALMLFVSAIAIFVEDEMSGNIISLAAAVMDCCKSSGDRLGEVSREVRLDVEAQERDGDWTCTKELCMEFNVLTSTEEEEERVMEDNIIKSISWFAVGMVFSGSGRDCDGNVERYRLRTPKCSSL